MKELLLRISRELYMAEVLCCDFRDQRPRNMPNQEEFPEEDLEIFFCSLV